MTLISGTKSISSASISPENRGILFGDGVFDVLKYASGKLYFWEAHYLRLMATMRIARMEIPDTFTMEFLESEILSQIEQNQLANQAVSVRLTIVRKQGGDYTPQTNTIEYYISVAPLQSPFYQNQPIEYRIELYKDFYLQPDLLSNLKTTNRLLNVMGSVFAQENDYQNCILLNYTHKNVVGFLNGNLFWVSGTHIKTPPLSDGCINGITRKKLIETITKTNDFTIEETSISPFDLQKADELFVTNSIIGIQSVSHYRKKEYTNQVANNLIGKLNTLARLG